MRRSECAWDCAGHQECLEERLREAVAMIDSLTETYGHEWSAGYRERAQEFVRAMWAFR